MTTAKSGTPAVASEVLAYCGSCKMDLNAVVVAMKGDRVAKVQCLTCKKEHTFKAAKGVTTPKKTRKKKSDDAPKGASIEAEWEKLMAQHKEAPLKVYNTKGSFILGDKINHATFGEGIVGRLIYPNKIEVIFRTDMKVLIYGGTQHTS
jgi:hypothetical protein